MLYNTGSRKRSLGGLDDPRVPYSRAGWNDAREGRPYDYALCDRAPSPDCATAYEIARLRVMALRAHGERVPAWRAAGLGPAIRESITTANRMNKAHRESGPGGFWPVGPNYWQAATP
jgi:hypothetical protein